MGPSDAFGSFRGDESDLDAEADERIRHRISRLTARDRDPLGRIPFEDTPAPLPLERPEPGAGIGRRPGRGRLVAAAAAVVVVLVGVAIVSRAGEEDDELLSGIGDVTLEGLAARAADLPDQPLGPDEYLYQHLDEGVSADDGGAGGIETVETERWVAADGTGREVTSDRVLLDPTTGSTHVLIAGSETNFAEPGSLSFDGLSYEEIRSLPADPESLASALPDARVGDVSVLAWRLTTFADLLMLPIISPDVKGAALEGLAEIGLDAVGELEDRSGRPGVGFALTADGTTWLVIIDPITTLVTELRVADGAEVSDPGTATTWYSVLDTGITTSFG